MPDNLPPIDPTPVPEGTQPPAGDPPTPQYATVEDMEARQKTQDEAMSALQKQNSDLMSTLNTVLSNQQAPQPAPAQQAPSLTGKQIDEMFANGEGGDQILDHFNNQINNKIDKLTNDVINPMRAAGASSIASIAKQNAKNTLPYYSMFSKEIEDYMSKLDTGLQTNPEVYQIAHDKIVGQNVDKIIELKQQETLRKKQEADATHQQTPPTGRQGSGDDPNKVPPPEEFWDSRAMDMLRDQKITPDQWAQKMGFKDYDAMYYSSTEQEDPRDVAARAAKEKGVA